MIVLFGLTTTGVANNPKQNVKGNIVRTVKGTEPSRNMLKMHQVVREVATTTTTVPPTTTTNIVTTTTAPSAPVTLSTDPSIVTDADRAAWQKVAICEESGDWTVQGSLYSGGLGMLNSTWVAYGGLEFAPNAGLATIDQQIIVAKRIQTNPPDQNGCSGSW